MKKEHLSDALDTVSLEKVERFIKKDEELKKAVKKRKLARVIRRFSGVAALAVCTVISIIFPIIMTPYQTHNRNADQSTSSSIVSDTSTSENIIDKVFDPVSFAERFKSKHNGEEVTILCWTSEYPEFEVTESALSSGDALWEAIYQRNKKAIDDLGVKFVFNVHKDGSTYLVDALKYVSDMSALDNPFDIMAMYSTTTVMLAQKGFISPISDYPEYIDLTNDWYPTRLREDANIKGNIYYVTGDISVNNTYNMHSIIFNKDLLVSNESIGFTPDTLYTLAREGKWTLDKMYEFVGDYYVDIDKDEKKSINDGYGIRTYRIYLDCIYHGAGLNMFAINNSSDNPDTLITISQDYSSQKSIDLAKAMGTLMVSSGMNDDQAYHNFAQGNDITMIGRFSHLQLMREKYEPNIDFGILPAPKYDLAQSEYISISNQPSTLWSIYASGNKQREEMSAGVIEYLGYCSQETTAPAIFKKLFAEDMQKRVHDAEMYELISRTQSCDIGIYLNRTFTHMIVANDWGECATLNQDWGKNSTIFIKYLDPYALSASQDFWTLTGKLKQNRTQ